MNTKINNIKLVGMMAILLVGVLALSGCASSEQTALAVSNSAAQVNAPDPAVASGNTAIQNNDQGGNGQDQRQADGAAVNVNSAGSINQAGLTQSLDAIPVGDLDEAETEGILFMREEEKLARDVYLTLYDVWGMPTFQNIAGSEQTHMDAVLSLIDRYSLEDPAQSNDVGVFTNPDLQALYDQLVAQGSESLAGALKVGGAIEEIDILDLEKHLAETDNADIQTVYNSLLQGSNNHLRAFSSTLERQTGESYHPQYLDQEAYDAIVNSSMQRGGNRQGGGNGKGRGGNGGGGRGQGGGRG